MLTVLHGNDEFAISEAVKRIRNSVTPEEIRDANTTVFQGNSISLPEIVGAAQAVPFMADKRLVLVEGVLTRLQNKDANLADGWKNISEAFDEMPSQNQVVFIEAETLRNNGLALKSVGQLADVQLFNRKRGPQLEIWIRDRFESHGGTASREAISRLSWLSGGDTRLLDQDIQKLALFAGDRQITPSDVDLMVTDSSTTSVFRVVDAVIGRKPAVAMKHLYSMLSDGASFQYVLSMLARQVRLLILAIELRSQGLPQDEIGRRIGVTNQYALDNTMRQTNGLSVEQLAAIHRRLLAADISVKTGELDERLSIELLVGELSGA
jgi:DNA polymerase-3 subunit delta